MNYEVPQLNLHLVPSHTGTGNRCKLEFDGFDPMLSAIFCTADVMDDIDNVSASRVVALLELCFCFFNFKLQCT